MPGLLPSHRTVDRGAWADLARLLAVDGYGTDEFAALDKVDEVLRRRLQLPASDSMTGMPEADLPLLRWLVAFADDQRAACSADEYRRALGRAREGGTWASDL